MNTEPATRTFSAPWILAFFMGITFVVMCGGNVIANMVQRSANDAAATEGK